MAQFYADIHGNKGRATKEGTKKSGIKGHIRGRDIGAIVYMEYNEKTQQDECTIHLTNGSTGNKRAKLLGLFTAKDME